MATIETLMAQIADAGLRVQLAREVAELKRRLDQGLVFERHLPKRTRVLSAPIRVGSVVWERRSTRPCRLRVRGIDGDELVVVVEPENATAPADAATERIARGDVLVEQDFAESVFPLITPIGSVCRGAADQPRHAAIQGENFHALGALLFAYELPSILVLIPAASP